MDEANADYYYDLDDTSGHISITKINWDFLKECSDEWEMVCDICDIDDSVLMQPNTDDYYTEDDWNAFLELYHDVIQQKLIGMYMVEIDDHFSKAYDVMQSARKDCELICHHR